MHMNSTDTLNETDAAASGWINSAERTLDTEIAALQSVRAALGGRLATPFSQAVKQIQSIDGRVIVTGVGKSGHIGTKMAATFASTGTPAFFVHASEASHGDLGMITDRDVIIAISWSGETQELASSIAFTRRFKIPLIAITSRADSALGRAADIVLDLPKVEEACPHGLAPTSSTIIQMAMGDALALALLESRGFTASDFKVFHPGGRLGASLQLVRDIMHTGEHIPVAPFGTTVRDAIVLMTGKGFGSVAVVNELHQMVGVLTDGDLRRHLDGNVLECAVQEIMTHNPKVIAPELLVASALEILNSSAITALYVVEDKRPVGIVHLHDLLRIGAA